MKPAKQTLTNPKIRFPEFQNDWTEKQFNTLIEEYVERVPANTELPIYSSSRNGLKLQKDYYDNREVLNEGEYGVVPKGHFTYRHMSDDLTFKFNLNDFEEKIAVSKEYPVFRPVDVDPKFLLYKLNESDDLKRFAIMQKKGGTRTRLYLKVLKTWKSRYPTIREQEKISAFLNKLDRLLMMLSKEMEALLNYKIGIVQKLESQEIRFKDKRNKNYPNWILRKLNDVLEEHKLKSTGKEEVYSVSIHKGLINQIEHLGRSYSAETTDHYNLVNPGEIVYTKSPTGNFPFGIIKQSHIAKSVIISPLYGVFKPESFGLGYFLHSYFESPINTNNYLKPIIRKGAKNTINITNKTFLSKELKLPRSIEEQTKIGHFLKLIDSKISILDRKIILFRQWKTGLLQQIII